ncbi:MAG: T9SS type A sorting domain-containing protein [Bacteroidetes bacterium]|nr:T9SS type A sorting domain-containing protein [Bacteroidota bacterium]
MMYKLLLCFILCLPFQLAAQININSNVFPAVGDTLRMSVDRLPENLKTGDSGGPRTWDYKDLEAPYALAMAMRSVKEGNWATEFKEANMLGKLPGGQEYYYRKTAQTIDLLGFYGSDPVGLGIQGLCRYSPAITDRRAPMRYLDRHTPEFELQMTISAEEAQGSFLDSIPITPDSLRIRIKTKRLEITDAYGSMQLPGNVYRVLRVKYEDKMDIILEAKLPFVGWQDVTALLPENDYFGKRLETNFVYYSNQIKEPAAVVKPSGRRLQNVASIQFKAPYELSTAKQGLIPGVPGVLAYPNPAITTARFDFVNLSTGNYRLAFYNILGQKVREEMVWVSGNKTLKLELGDFKKGTYLYSLIDEQGKTLSTKRLMIIRP